MSKKLNIGFDYDGTITLDPQIFSKICWLFLKNGDGIYLITSRHSSELTDDIRLFAAKNGLDIICTGRVAKATHMKAMDIKINIWIDDNPASVYHDVNRMAMAALV